MKTITGIPESTVAEDEIHLTQMIISGTNEKSEISHRIRFSDLQEYITRTLNERVRVLEELLSGTTGMSAVPIRGIVLFHGQEAEVPLGWAICDGRTVPMSSGVGSITTPDMRDRIAMGAGTIVQMGATAGSREVTGETGSAGSHVHSVTGGSHFHSATISPTVLGINHLPPHNHGNGVTDSGNPAGVFSYGQKASPRTSDSIDNNGNDGTWQGLTETIGGGEAHTHGASITGEGPHDHDVSNSGDHSHTIAFQNTPPVLGLHYIMRV